MSYVYRSGQVCPWKFGLKLRTLNTTWSSPDSRFHLLQPKAKADATRAICWYALNSVRGACNTKLENMHHFLPNKALKKKNQLPLSRHLSKLPLTTLPAASIQLAIWKCLHDEEVEGKKKKAKPLACTHLFVHTDIFVWVLFWENIQTTLLQNSSEGDRAHPFSYQLGKRILLSHHYCSQHALITLLHKPMKASYWWKKVLFCFRHWLFIASWLFWILPTSGITLIFRS